MMSGKIELDESYFGGYRKGKRGRGAAGKIPVFGLLKRAGKVLCFAKSGASDDYACVVLDGALSGKYIMVHDFADPGWEFILGAEVDTLGEMIELIISDIIDIEEHSEL